MIKEEISNPPEWLVKHIKPEVKLEGKRLKSEEWGECIYEGNRNNELTRRAGSLISKDIPEPEVSTMLKAWNQEHCKPPLSDKEIDRIVKSIGKRDSQKKNENRYRLTDLGNAERFRDEHRDELRYCREMKKWFYFDGTKWVPDKTGRAIARAKQTIRNIYKNASKIEDDNEREATVKHALKCESDSRIKAMLSLAESELPILLDDFDRDPWLLNCRNGTLNLKTGKLRPHDPNDFISMVTGCDYKPGKMSEVFNNFLITSIPDPDTRKYVQKLVGYTAAGVTTEEVMGFIYGPPGTGKSTLLSAIYTAFGDYSTILNFESLLKNDKSGATPRNDIAKLHRKRFVQSMEVEEGRKLAEALLNTMTGGDHITARYLYCEEYEFLPAFTLFLAANNRPQVSDPESGLWRRIKQIPFYEQISDEDKDPELKLKLKNPDEDMQAVLNWIVEGCRLWQEEGLKVPELVKKTTEEYKEESDPLKGFIDENCLLGPNYQVSNVEIRESYLEYCKKNGIRFPLSQKRFSNLLYKKGLDQYNSAGRFWIGIGLLKIHQASRS